MSIEANIGTWIDECCPKCGSQMLGNLNGAKWCSMVGCDYGLNLSPVRKVEEGE